MINKEQYENILKTVKDNDATLVAVSKFKNVEDIKALYDLGQRDFGENYVQELMDKQAYFEGLGINDIRWHFIGHLQTNKVKYIASFVHLIHGVDSLKLLNEINKQAAKHQRILPVLLQMHIAQEETKFGMDHTEAYTLCEYYSANKGTYKNISIDGVMGMASFSEDLAKVKGEFDQLVSVHEMLQKHFFLASNRFKEISMGMSGDYELALASGSTMVRIGSLIFGNRN